MIAPFESQSLSASPAARLPNWGELLGIALIVTAASDAIPYWLCNYILYYGFYTSSARIYANIGFANFYDLIALLFGLILAVPSWRRSGLRIGTISKHWPKVLAVMAVPIILTAIVYPRLPVRPFAGASISMWLTSPLAQDLVFVGYIYGRFAERGDKPWLPWLPINLPLILSSLFFVMWHLPNFIAMPPGYVLFQLGYVLVGALWLGMIRVWTGSMIYVTVVHMAVNGIAWYTS